MALLSSTLRKEVRRWALTSALGTLNLALISSLVAHLAASQFSVLKPGPDTRRAGPVTRRRLTYQRIDTLFVMTDGKDPCLKCQYKGCKTKFIWTLSPVYSHSIQNLADGSEFNTTLQFLPPSVPPAPPRCWLAPGTSPVPRRS